jgi:hypothetical protein
MPNPTLKRDCAKAQPLSYTLGIARMANPRLTKDQRTDLFAPLFEQVRKELDRLSAGDDQLLWALRRKLAKELVYLERSTPAARGKLKALMFKKQAGLCAFCGLQLPEKGSELDRKEAFLGYVEENVRLVHHHCHVDDQAKKRYA